MRPCNFLEPTIFCAIIPFDSSAGQQTISELVINLFCRLSFGKRKQQKIQERDSCGLELKPNVSVAFEQILLLCFLSEIEIVDYDLELRPLSSLWTIVKLFFSP
jgi:hypothetical protein